ncbi:hypothetical protein N0V93_004145 [Gnomoniopsis smithogilvyi]|uniref:Uncharacterized protein n=1 Tax=Gnomoniopsis smithogilvyi TaxID=1191159 RepID=A0A9W8YQY6_9PEZI|nr:hypothetical protein N0V93_004145 [Gnomoniopsis smithogilvyi]
MIPPKSHMRPGASASAHVLSDRKHDIHLERLDHDTDLTDIDEELEARDSLAQHMSFDSSDESDFNHTSLSDIIDGLPTAVKSLGPLRTIRRSASIRSWVSYFYEISTSSMGAQISHEEHAEEHHHTLVSTSTTTTEVELQQQQHQPMNSKRRRASNTMRSTKGPATSTELVEYVDPERKGIDRFCGIQGQSLVNNALSERRSSFSQGCGADGDRSNERRAYVQGLAWLLQGLPRDLDDQERQDLTRSMPPPLLGEINGRRGHRRGGPSLRHADATGGRSFIQRVVAALIVQLIVPMQFLWAYLITLLGHAVYLERKYKVTEHVVKHSSELGYTVGKNGVKLSGVIYKNGGARVGAVITDAVAYVADGVVKGISDGIREACLELKEDGDR